MNETVKSEIADASVAATRPVHVGMKRFSSVQFLIAIVALFIAFPFLDDLRFGAIIETLLMTLVMVSGVMAVGRTRSVKWMAVILVTPTLLVKWLSHYREDWVQPEVFRAAGIVFIAFVVVQLLRSIFKAPRVNVEVLCTGISIYLLLGLIWTFAYLLVARWDPASFAFTPAPTTNPPMTRFSAFYFSFITLSTVGYGDVTPVSKAARELAVMEAITGTLFIAVLIARLVALLTTQNLSSSDPESRQRKD